MTILNGQIVNPKTVEGGVKWCIDTFPILKQPRCEGSKKLALFYINYLGITGLEEFFDCPKGVEPETVLREFRWQLNPNLKNYEQERVFRDKFTRI